jgi:hypothetical protein
VALRGAVVKRLEADGELELTLVELGDRSTSYLVADNSGHDDGWIATRLRHVERGMFEGSR